MKKTKRFQVGTKVRNTHTGEFSEIVQVTQNYISVVSSNGIEHVLPLEVFNALFKEA